MSQQVDRWVYYLVSCSVQFWVSLERLCDMPANLRPYSSGVVLLTRLLICAFCWGGASGANYLVQYSWFVLYHIFANVAFNVSTQAISEYSCYSPLCRLWRNLFRPDLTSNLFCISLCSARAVFHISRLFEDAKSVLMSVFICSFALHQPKSLNQGWTLVHGYCHCHKI